MNVIAEPFFTRQGHSAQYVCVYVGHTLCFYVTHGFDLNDGPSDEAVVFSSRQKLAPSTTATCLRAPPTPSTSMTRPRRRRRTWCARRLICSTRLKDRWAFDNGFLLSYCEQKIVERCWLAFDPCLVSDIQTDEDGQLQAFCALSSVSELHPG